MTEFMSLQQAFDTAAKQIYAQGGGSFLLSQNEYHPELEPKLNCRYRGPDGIKCNLGACIPDELYDENIEGQTPVSYKDNIINVIEKVFGPAADYSFKCKLRNLQLAHDNACKDENFFLVYYSMMWKFAKDFYISEEVLLELERDRRLAK